MRSRTLPVTAAALVALALAGSATAGTVLLDFNDLVAGNSYSGDRYLASGVSFRQVSATPDFPTRNPGDVLGIAQLTFGSGDIVAYNNGVVHNGPNSPPSTPYVYAPGTRDMLMSFTTAVTSASVDLDTYIPEGGDTVRLIALRLVAGQFVVVQSVEAIDDPGNPGRPFSITLNVNPGSSFQYLLFQSTTEQEGFDNLTYTVVPVPSTVLMGGAGLAGVAGIFGARRRKHM